MNILANPELAEQLSMEKKKNKQNLPTRKYLLQLKMLKDES